MSRTPILNSVPGGRYTINEDLDRVVLVAPTSAFSVQLPSAVPLVGRQFAVIRTSASNGINVTVTTVLGQTIGGSSTQTLTNLADSVRVISDGANWQSIATSSGSGTVTSVTAGDSSVTVGGTVTAPTLAVGSRLAPTATTIGYADLGPPTTLPDSTFGAAEISAASFTTESPLASMPSTVRTVTCYISAHESANDGQTSVNTNPENDTDSDSSRSAMCQHSITTMLGDIFLKASGSTIVDSFSCKIPDLSNPDYQKYSAIQLRARADRWGITDYRFDTFNDTIIGTGGIATLPDGVVSASDWENRFVLPYAKAVFGFLRRSGRKVWINGTGSSDTSLTYHGLGLAYDNRGDGRLRWMNRLAPYVDGFEHEFAFQGADNIPFNDSYAVTGTLTTYKDWWRYHLRIPALASQLGKGYLMYVYNYNNGQSYRFARGSALLVWGGVTPMYLLVSEGTADSSPTYKWNAGFPKENGHRIHSVSNYVRIRKYDNGVIIVNADPTTAHTVNGHSVPAGDAYFDVGASY